MATGIHARNLRKAAGDDLPGTSHADGSDPAYQQLPAFETNAGAAAPFATSAVQVQTLYLTEAGTAAPISVVDIHQGQLGDCYLLSPIGELALFHPTAISNMIHNNGNGTETVTLYVDKNGRMPSFGSSAFKAVSVTVNNAFSAACVNNGATQDVVGNQKEIWPQVIEKAAATLAGGYNAIAYGGYPVLAMEQLTGRTASYLSPAALSLSALQSYIAAGDLITMDTGRSGLGYGLVSSHCYMFSNIVGSGSSAAVQLLNPWGTAQPAAIPLSRLAQSGIVQVDIGRFT
jgi:hypothetical protein